MYRLARKCPVTDGKLTVTHRAVAIEGMILTPRNTLAQARCGLARPPAQVVARGQSRSRVPFPKMDEHFARPLDDGWAISIALGEKEEPNFGEGRSTIRSGTRSDLGAWNADRRS